MSAALLCETCAFRDSAKIFQTVQVNMILPETQELS